MQTLDLSEYTLDDENLSRENHRAGDVIHNGSPIKHGGEYHEVPRLLYEKDGVANISFLPQSASISASIGTKVEYLLVPDKTVEKPRLVETSLEGKFDPLCSAVLVDRGYSLSELGDGAAYMDTAKLSSALRDSGEILSEYDKFFLANKDIKPLAVRNVNPERQEAMANAVVEACLKNVDEKNPNFINRTSHLVLEIPFDVPELAASDGQNRSKPGNYGDRTYENQTAFQILRGLWYRRVLKIAGIKLSKKLHENLNTYWPDIDPASIKIYCSVPYSVATEEKSLDLIVLPQNKETAELMGLSFDDETWC